MCLIFLSIQNHPKYPLIVAANRDEFYKRKTSPAGFWADHRHILGGRDLEAGGTWLGMTLSGKISMITNYRDLKNLKPQAPSRGELTTNFLSREDPAETYMKKIQESGPRYNGFNFLAGTPDELWYFSNYGNGIQKLNAGLYGLSNHLLDTPWPKVTRGKEMMQPLLQQPEISIPDLFDALSNEHRAPDNQLPETGVSLDRERMLSSMFIKSPDYGSRSSTIILVDKQNHVRFTERVYEPNTGQHSTKEFEFDVVTDGPSLS
ncbi:MAG: NRDE family protein [Cytophagales bacterium]|nr:NRDE family protein [Cytophagales bacterium]